MNDELRRQDDSEIREMRNRFDRHLEIYAQNGKELSALKSEVSALRDDLKGILRNVISKTEFEPIKKLAYGLVSVILLSVAGAIIALVLK